MKQSFTILKLALVLACIVYYLTSYCLYKYGKINKNLNITITAHTGCNGQKPNSIASLEEGYNSSAQILEFDLYFDKLFSSSNREQSRVRTLKLSVNLWRWKLSPRQCSES